MMESNRINTTGLEVSSFIQREKYILFSNSFELFKKKIKI